MSLVVTCRAQSTGLTKSNWRPTLAMNSDAYRRGVDTRARLHTSTVNPTLIEVSTPFPLERSEARGRHR
jgi:hypothetical protein